MSLMKPTQGRYTCTACATDAAYADGPTTCMAHPRVRSDIAKRVKQANVLSTADARMAQGMGLLSIPSVGRTGWNDGVIYPLTDLPGMSAARSKRSPVSVASRRPSIWGRWCRKRFRSAHGRGSAKESRCTCNLNA